MNDWIEWVYTPEKPYPETLDTLIYVRHRNGWEDLTPIHVGFWYDHEQPEASNWYQGGNEADIVAYRVAS